jgi:reverse gyrase
MAIDKELAEANLVLYGGTCPNCGGVISDERLSKGAPCSDCLPLVEGGFHSLSQVVEELRRLRNLKNLRGFSNALREEEELRAFFKRCVGSEPWSIQRLWIRRISKRSSFAMIAPTGIGKTTLGLVAALYYSFKGRKSYFIVPTTTLVIQAERKLIEFLNRMGGAASVLAIHSKLRRKEREERERRLEDPRGFDILITTSRYFVKNYDKISKHDFTFIFVDDVDAVLRGSKAINYLLKLMGFTDEDIEDALKIIKLKRELGVRSESSELVEELRKLRSRLEKRKNTDKVLIIASATGNPRGLKVRLFRELIGFEIGARPELIRNIEDTYLKVRDLEEAVEEVTRLVRECLGGGGLIYVPVDLGIGFAEELASRLRSRGVVAEAMHSRKIKTLEDFNSGSVDVLVGVATYYGVLVRGIDLPARIRYAVFVDVPRHKINLRLERLSATDVLRLMPLLRDVVVDPDDKSFLENAFVKLRRVLRRSGGYFLKVVGEVLEGVRGPQTASEKLFMEVYARVHELLKDEAVVEGLVKHPEVVVVREGEALYVLIPDAPTYIQASGRTSRLYLGGVSKGLSVVVTWNEKLLKALERRLKLLTGEFEFRNLLEIDLNQVINEINRTREEILAIGRGELIYDLGRRVELKTALMVVESPNKARTIARMFGKPSVKEYGRLRVYEVNLGNYTLLITASGGHVYELITDQGIEGVDPANYVYGVLYRGGTNKPSFIPVFAPIRRCVRCGHQFATLENRAACPLCGSEGVLSSSDVIQSLREVAYEVDEVLIATDPDTEGEKIAYDLYQVLTPYNRNIKRVEFHEVTRKAVTQALSSPRDLNFRLVKAQLLRRIEDRWVGFSLSGKLQNDFWKNYFCSRLTSAYQEPGSSRPRKVSKYLVLCSKYRESYKRLSAGRVQSPVLGWIIESYEEHRKSLSKYLVLRFKDLKIMTKVPESLKDLITQGDVSEVRVNVRCRGVSEESVSPPPPYTTDTALSEISSVLGISASQVMKVLQELFEFGLITYHRTDSVRVSDAGIKVAREYLSEKLGESWDKFFEGRAWGVGGAHECIRPTRPIDAETLRELISEGVIEIPRRLHNTHFRVYDMIFRRFIASQMSKALVRKRDMEFRVEVITRDSRRLELPPISKEVVSEVVFEGFNKVLKVLKTYQVPGDGIYSSEGSDFEYRVESVYEVPLHTEASVVRTMKERGIGRPSTYAKIIETILKRRYAFSKRRGELIPSLLGREVYNYLTERYARLVSEERTRVLENKMSSVESDDTLYNELLRELYEELRANELLGVTGYEL